MNKPIAARLTWTFTAALLGAALIGACQGSTGALPAGYGRLSVSLVDAPNPEVTEIFVTINKVTAHSTTEGWVTVMNKTVTVDLLKLQTQSMALGFADLPAGKITQIRLYVDEAGPRYVTLPDGSKIDLKVPSGIQSGIKINGPFNLAACENTDVTLDFDGKKSIWVHPTGQGDLWILRPVIHAKAVSSTGVACEGTTPAEGGGKGNGNGNGKGNGNGNGNKPGEGDGSDAGTDISEGGGIPGVSLPGAACAMNSECQSGVCSAGVCALGGPATPCTQSNQCASGVCTEGECSVGSAGTTGSACTQPAQCLSNTCTAGACEAGGTGAPCVIQADCVEGLSCNQNSCTPVIL